MSDQNTQDFLARFLEGFTNTFQEDSESFREVNEAVTEARGEDYQSIRRFEKMMAENPTMQTIVDAVPDNFRTEKGKQLKEERARRGMGLDEDIARRLGQVTGRLGSDIRNDSTRGVWWLLNAPQAVVDVGAEAFLHKMNPDLHTSVYARDENDDKIVVDNENFEQAFRAGLVNEQGVKQKNVGYSKPEEYTDDRGNTRTRRYYTRPAIEPGFGNSVRMPAALAINAGMGLMHYAGGMEGYTAALPSEADPTKTSNMLGEIAMKYIVGRTGNLLPYDEFRKVRPDVSQGEYNAYKAFKYDKSLDFNPFDDGSVNLAPGGILKATADGIHGAEVQFLGRSMPVNETLVPVASAVLGAGMGVYGGADARENNKKFMGIVEPVRADEGLTGEAERRQLRNRTMRRSALGGFGGYAAGAIAGNLLEEERRRRNQEANFGS